MSNWKVLKRNVIKGVVYKVSEWTPDESFVDNAMYAPYIWKKIFTAKLIGENKKEETILYANPEEANISFWENIKIETIISQI